MKEFIKRNFAILLAFILPALLIIIVAVTTYLPSLFVSTHYNFIYTTCADGTNYYPYNCNGYLQQVYSVVNGKLVKNNVDLTQDFNKDGVPDFSEAYNARVFFHDTKKNESREITFTEAQALTLNNLLTSPEIFSFLSAGIHLLTDILSQKVKITASSTLSTALIDTITRTIFSLSAGFYPADNNYN